MSAADVVTVPEAAARLGVDATRVRALIAAEMLDARRIGGRWLVSRASVERREAAAPGRGRPFSPRAAWTLLWLASGYAATDWVEQRHRARLVGLLRAHGLAAIAPRLHGRGRPRGYSKETMGLDEISADSDVVRTGAAAHARAAADTGATPSFEAYVPDAAVARLVRDHSLRTSARPQVVLRVVPEIWPFEPGLSVAPPAAIALDLLESVDDERRRTAQILLDSLPPI